MSIILHLDMNSYFASVEQQANPHLRGRPVGVCEHLGGIIIAPSVEAKRLGIKLGTTVWDARKIYPKIVLLPVDPDKYRHVTASFLRILMDYTDEVEKASIDEAFANLTSVCANYDEALLLALEIKQRLRQEVGEWVSCSIGIGPNRLVAKIAADLGEGDINRIAVVRPEDIPALYDRLKLTDIPGIAHRLERALNKLGIFTLRELAEYPLGNLLNQFGINGYLLHELANLNNPSQPPLTFPPKVALPLAERGGKRPPLSVRGGEGELFIDQQIKSIGHSYTLPKSINKIGETKKLMYKLAEKIGRRMRRLGARGNIVHYFHSDKRYVSFHKQHKIKEFINDGRDIYQAAFEIFKYSITPSLNPSPRLRRMGEGRWGVKIMGITVSGLVFDKPPEPLFEQYKKPVWLVTAMDKINNKYGEFVIRRGRLVGIPEEWGKDTVGFGRMKEFTAPSQSPP